MVFILGETKISSDLELHGNAMKQNPEKEKLNAENTEEVKNPVAG